MLVNMRSLDRIWFPHFVRGLAPVQQAGVRLIWHCDGSLSAMAPRLLEVGLHGFQGFQYEDGIDYAAICRMKTREGVPVSQLHAPYPYGTSDAVRQEMKWIVANGPASGLFLGASSSITSGVPWENLQALVEGFHYYRQHGR